MGLAADARAATQRPGPQQCRVAKFLEANPDLVDDFNNAMKDRIQTSTRGLASVIDPKWGISSGSLQHHRRGECASCNEAGRTW
jgi:hypothetical protein